MNRRRIQRLCAVVHTEKARALLICLWADPPHLGQRLDPLETATRLAVACRHDGARSLGAQASHMREQRGGRDVEVHTHGVDGGLDDLVEGAGEAALVDVMLIHAHA